MVVTFKLKSGKRMVKLQKLLSDLYPGTKRGQRDIYYCGFGTKSQSEIIMRAGFKSSDVVIETFRNSQRIFEEAEKISSFQVDLSGPQVELDKLRSQSTFNQPLNNIIERSTFWVLDRNSFIR